MKENRDYTQDLADIRSMMERSSKFMSLSGLAGVMAGIYALVGVWFVYSILNISPYQFESGLEATQQFHLSIVGIIILVLSLATAIAFSYRKATKRGETVWNATSKRMLANMFMPLFTGGILILIAMMKDVTLLVLPMSLIFYGMALYNASNFSYSDVKYLGLTQVGLGLFAALYPDYGLILWAIGFGAVHIVYGIYMHIRYER
jgi:hypothetical protein